MGFSWKSLVGGFLGGVLFSFTIFKIFLTPIEIGTIKSLRQSDLNPDTHYSFIDPLIGLKNTRGNEPSNNYPDLQNEINTIIKKAKNNNSVDTASVLFNNYSESAGFTINPTEKYNPASLTKVPTMIVYYKLAEEDSSVFSKKITYTGEDMNAQENIVSPIQLTKNNNYSVEELVEHMIRYSDNNAAQMLINNLNDIGKAGVFARLFKDLGITEIDLNDDYITISAYSLFFRILYNATYLTRDDSEKALGLLTRTDFTKGLLAGVPNNIKIAQKFGEFTVTNTDGTLIKRELHNCGIVYYPNHPYLLCIMTKGEDFTKLEEVISEVSQKIYKYVEKVYPNQQK